MFDRGLNAPALADATGIERSTINGLERGAHYPSTAVLLVLVDYFNCSADFLLGITDIHEEGRTFKPVQPYGPILRDTLKKHNITQYRIEKDIPISGATIYGWLHDKIVPSVDSFIKVAEYVGVTVDSLLGRED